MRRRDSKLQSCQPRCSPGSNHGDLFVGLTGHRRLSEPREKHPLTMRDFEDGRSEHRVGMLSGNRP